MIPHSRVLIQLRVETYLFYPKDEEETDVLLLPRDSPFCKRTCKMGERGKITGRS